MQAQTLLFESSFDPNLYRTSLRKPSIIQTFYVSPDYQWHTPWTLLSLGFQCIGWYSDVTRCVPFCAHWRALTVWCWIRRKGPCWSNDFLEDTCNYEYNYSLGVWEKELGEGGSWGLELDLKKNMSFFLLLWVLRFFFFGQWAAGYEAASLSQSGAHS